jgi:hypothetical protein
MLIVNRVLNVPPAANAAKIMKLMLNLISILAATLATNKNAPIPARRVPLVLQARLVLQALLVTLVILPAAISALRTIIRRRITRRKITRRRIARRRIIDRDTVTGTTVITVPAPITVTDIMTGTIIMVTGIKEETK